MTFVLRWVKANWQTDLHLYLFHLKSIHFALSQKVKLPPICSSPEESNFRESNNLEAIFNLCKTY